MRKTVALFVLLFAAVTNARAQSDTLSYAATAPRWVAQFTTLSANAAIGGLTAGIIQKIKHGSFKDGFTRGAFGGSIVYAGKYVAAQRFTGAGLIGREVGAAGASVVRNASDAVGSFDRLILPLTVTRLYWDRKKGTTQLKLDVVATGHLIYGITEKELHFDARESLSGGTFIFRTDNKVITYGVDHQHAGGVTSAGIIFRSDVPGWGSSFLRRALAHERVHVVQDDQLFITLNDRLDDYLFAKSGLQRVSNYVDLNGVTEFLRQIGRLIPEHGNRPWEMEAIYLAR